MKPRIKKTLHRLEKSSSEFWNISPQTGFFINLIIRDRKYKTILEIGTSNGYSGIWITEALGATKGRLYTMESNEKRCLLAKKNFLASGLSDFITQIFGHAPEDLPASPKKFDMIFLDATKYEHMDYFKAVKSRIAKGGMIITDNIISHKNELKDYIKIINSDHSFRSIKLNIGSGLMLSLKETRQLPS
ncbi:MAG: class I SAM-dependent methyltransferase [Candidatus Peregrinibacteria bacterium]